MNRSGSSTTGGGGGGGRVGGGGGGGGGGGSGSVSEVSCLVSSLPYTKHETPTLSKFCKKIFQKLKYAI